MKWFSPRSRRLLVLLAALAGVAVTASMGRWQLQRAELQRGVGLGQIRIHGGNLREGTAVCGKKRP